MKGYMANDKVHPHADNTLMYFDAYENVVLSLSLCVLRAAATDMYVTPAYPQARLTFLI